MLAPVELVEKPGTIAVAVVSIGAARIESYGVPRLAWYANPEKASVVRYVGSGCVEDASEASAGPSRAGPSEASSAASTSSVVASASGSPGVPASPERRPRETPASRSSPGVYGVSAEEATTSPPHWPFPGWQLSPAPHVETCPTHCFASTRYSACMLSLGTCTCATRCTTACPIDELPLNAVTVMSASSPALLPEPMANVAGRVASIDPTT